jgi:hypothetical protein
MDSVNAQNGVFLVPSSSPPLPPREKGAGDALVPVHPLAPFLWGIHAHFLLLRGLLYICFGIGVGIVCPPPPPPPGVAPAMGLPVGFAPRQGIACVFWCSQLRGLPVFALMCADCSSLVLPVAGLSPDLSELPTTICPGILPAPWGSRGRWGIALQVVKLVTDVSEK